MKAIMMTVRLWWFYLTYKGIKTIEIRKRFAKDFKGKIFACVSKTNWKKDLVKIPPEERDFFKQFIGKVGLCFECDKVDKFYYNENLDYYTDIKDKGLPMKTILERSCLKDIDFVAYLNFGDGYAIHITKLEIFDKPKELSEFTTCKEIKGKEGGATFIYKPLAKPFQSWGYIWIE